MLYSSTVLCDLLMSCYTGTLQFNSEEIVNYLTAASYLQMDYIVESCRGALKKIMQLKNSSLSKASIANHTFSMVILRHCGIKNYYHVSHLLCYQQWLNSRFFLL